MTNYNGQKMNYPKGTTLEQWDRYKADLQTHTEFIMNYQFFLDRICRHLQWMERHRDHYTWTVDEIREVMSAEISKASSMDAPNEPGYYRANND